MYNCVLEISKRYNYTESQLRDIMVHEMIHYYLAYTGKDIKMKHGKEFEKMANHLNKKYGLNITATIDTNLYDKKPSFTLGYLVSCIFY
jgi:predicted SprT family Zn-dependent metalloprotease